MYMTKKVNEVKIGDMVRIPGKFETWVESIRVSDTGDIVLWGSWVLTMRPDDLVTVTQTNWGEKE